MFTINEQNQKILTAVLSTEKQSFSGFYKSQNHVSRPTSLLDSSQYVMFSSLSNQEYKSYVKTGQFLGQFSSFSVKNPVDI